MLQQDRVHTLRQTHSAATTLMPVITAGLTVAGAVLAAMEAKRARAASAAEDPSSPAEANLAATTTPLARSGRARRLTARAYIATLAGRLLLVILGIAIVLAIAIAATSTGKVGEAITITALILLTLYLVEKVARQA
jgi:hypothetical protein